MENTTIQYTMYIEATPNPASMKFVSNKLLIPEKGASAEYKNISETQTAPIAKQLFQFPFVKSVFISANYITITKIDAIDWDEITVELRMFLTEYLNAGNLIITALPKQEVAVDNTFTETQTRKSKYERWENVEDVFELIAPETFKNKQVVLVDDVITTGATIEACCQLLQQIEGIQISVLSIAYADK